LFSGFFWVARFCFGLFSGSFGLCSGSFGLCSGFVQALFGCFFKLFLGFFLGFFQAFSRLFPGFFRAYFALFWGFLLTPSRYDLLFTKGYHLVSPDTPTWCDEARANFLPCLNAGSVPMPIDHIFVRNDSQVLAWDARLFNEEPIASDHIGVSAKLYNCWWCIWF
jgi:hypothetical protein